MSSERRTKGERANAELVRAIFEEAWNRQRFDALEGHVAPVVRFDYHRQVSETSADALPGLISLWREAFPDLVLEIHDLIAEGDLVAVRLTFTGTHLGEWAGVAPTGRKVSIAEMMFFRFDDGRLVEMWEVFDDQGLLRQIT